MHIIVIIALLLRLAHSQNFTFTNPIIGGNSNNPTILKLNDYYYIILRDWSLTELTIYKSPILTSFQNVEKKVIFRAPVGYYGVAPNELIEINGGIYLYLHMNSPVGRRLFVITADNASDPMAGWTDPVRLLEDWDYPAADGTVLKHNGQLFFVWSRALTHYTLFIAPMTTPILIGNPKVMIKEPQHAWECHSDERCYAAAASLLYNRNVAYLIYTANYWGSPNYCLGQMSISEGEDPLNKENWQIVNEPVFWRNDAEDVYSTGVAEFTLSPDGTETWMLYHATISEVHVELAQTSRLEKIDWNADGSPRFPRPMGIHRQKPLPSGQTSPCAVCSCPFRN